MAEYNAKFDSFNQNVTMTIYVELTNSFRIRKWIALRLMELANWLVGIKTIIDDEDSD